MMRFCGVFFLICVLSGIHAIRAQEYPLDPKQTNVTGKDVLADMPWRMEKTDASGNLNSIPVHFFIKDADGIGANADVVYINIYLKNATDTIFGNPMVFYTYTDSAFLSLFSSKSVADMDLDIQEFDPSLPVKDTNYTIQFTEFDCSWPYDCKYTRVDHNLWYFTFNIPPEKLEGFDDVIDIKIYFSLDWETDDELYFRVFRYDDTFPRLQGWYRGDAHYHTMYTNNTAEFGLPLGASKEIAKAVGLDWITTTNHSCDYNEYGPGIQNNWTREKTEIQSLNSQDTTMLFIQSEEASVKNNEGDLVHMLCYPSGSSPYSLPYLGDGDGDLTSTALTIDNILDSLSQYGGFAYASHPFAGGDQLSSLVGGGIWNISDAAFPANGSPQPGHDVVICNTTSSPSDVYSVNIESELFKSKIKGGEIWNYKNTMATTDESFNPWNVGYDNGITPFSLYDTADTYEHQNRFLNNFEVTNFLNRRGLIMKNANNDLQNYKFYFSAGSDAHGDFNYSNTSFVFGVTGDISDAAIGKPSSVVFCQSGMGPAGSNVLQALENGHLVISDGPIITLGISTDGDDNTQEYIVGQEASPNPDDYLDSRLRIDLVSTEEFGNFNEIKITAGTQEGERHLYLPVDSSDFSHTQIYNLDSLIHEILAGDTIQDLEYFYVRAELSTFKDHDTLNTVYLTHSEKFHCYTNPVWIRKPDMTTVPVFESNNWNCVPYPNPFTNMIEIRFENMDQRPVRAELFNIYGAMVLSEDINGSTGTSKFILKTNSLSLGVYLLKVSTSRDIYKFKLLKTSLID